jgi:hypothetical protein
MDFELNTEDLQQLKTELNGKTNRRQQQPAASAGELVIRSLQAPEAAQLPVLFQAEAVDVNAVDGVTLQNWETLEVGFDLLEEQLIEQFRQRGRETAAKARAAYSKELATGLGKPQE